MIPVYRCRGTLGNGKRAQGVKSRISQPNRRALASRAQHELAHEIEEDPGGIPRE